MSVHEWETCTYTGGNAVMVAHNVTVEITCTGTTLPPTWFVNGTVVGTRGYSYRSDTNGMELTTTLMIDGNHACDPLNMVCKVLAEGGQLLFRHIDTLSFRG